jgi:hypothetical protein
MPDDQQESQIKIKRIAQTEVKFVKKKEIKACIIQNHS